jgi:hypothetical protein
VFVALAARFGAGADMLDKVEGRFAMLLANHLAQKAAKQPNIDAERAGQFTRKFARFRAHKVVFHSKMQFNTEG